jgi:putative Holliday junction resolvase
MTSSIPNKSIGKILALDVGERVVGIATCDEAQVLVTPHPPLVRDDGSLSLGKFKKLFQNFEPVSVLIGLPRQEGKGLSEMARKIHGFGEKMKKHFPQVHFIYVDEKLSTKSTRERYAHLDLRKNNSSINLDSFAAMEILEDYLGRE